MPKLYEAILGRNFGIDFATNEPRALTEILYQNLLRNALILACTNGLPKLAKSLLATQQIADNQDFPFVVNEVCSFYGT